MAAKNRFNPIDCLEAALPDEEYWLLLARDPAMPALLGIWASLRVGNVQAATENFMILMEADLVRHYQNHPDEAKSLETIRTAQRAAEWRTANLTAGPGGVPSWKSSLVRPKMMQTTLPGLPAPPPSPPGPAQEICPVCQELTCECSGTALTAKVACGLRQVTSDIQAMQFEHQRVQSPVAVAILRKTDDFVDRINGYASELEGESDA